MTGLFAFWGCPPLSPQWSRNAAERPVGSVRSGTYLPQRGFCQRVVYIMRHLPTENSLFSKHLAQVPRSEPRRSLAGQLSESLREGAKRSVSGFGGDISHPSPLA
jgi:hypothetical protein